MRGCAIAFHRTGQHTSIVTNYHRYTMNHCTLHLYVLPCRLTYGDAEQTVIELRPMSETP